MQNIDILSTERTARMQCVCIMVSNAIPTGGDSQSVDDWFAHVEALMVRPVIPTRALSRFSSPRLARQDVLTVIFGNFCAIAGAHTTAAEIDAARAVSLAANRA